MCYSVQSRVSIFVKVFLLFGKYMGKNVGKNISKNLRGKYSQNVLDHAKQCATDSLKIASKRVIQKTTEAIGNLIGNKIADRIMKVSKNSQHNNLETVTNEHYNEIPKERYISRKKAGNY